jgi:DNA-binding GntR family transcriptional regulator
MPHSTQTDSAPTLSGIIAEKLRASIAGGQLEPGKRLHLDELRADFGVSLSPLREALSHLCAEGYVITTGRRGYCVAPVSPDNLREVTRLRCEFESFALRESIRLGDDQWEGNVIAALYRLNKLERTSVEGDQLAQWEAAHSFFHRQLISACGLPLLLQFCATLHGLNDRYRRIFLRDTALDRDVKQEHEALCDATMEKRADDACELLRRHIERTSDYALRALTAQTP